MSLEQTAELYASVLRQLLPDGVYDTAEMTHVADDIYAHAKALAQADIDAHRLLQVLETIPVDLLADYEREYGLPMQCMVPDSQTIEERISVLRWIRQHRNVMNREYLEQILAIFGVVLLELKKHKPMQCTGTCVDPVNTEELRYKVRLVIPSDSPADLECIIDNYLPGYLRIDVLKMPLLFKTSKLYPALLIENIKIETSISKAVIFDPINIETESLIVGEVAITGARMIRGIEYRNINLETEPLIVSEVAITGARMIRGIEYINVNLESESLAISSVVITGAKYLRKINYLENSTKSESIGIATIITGAKYL